MRVEARNGMFYDDDDGLCKCIISEAGGKLYAFVQAVDTGINGEDRFPKRYWGEYSHGNPEGAIEKILIQGGKWPQLPAESLGWHLPDAEAIMPRLSADSSDQYREGFAYALARAIGEVSSDASVYSDCPYGTGYPERDAWYRGYEDGYQHAERDGLFRGGRDGRP